MLKKLSLISILLLIAVLIMAPFTSCSEEEAAEPVVIRMAAPWSVGQAPAEITEKMITAFNERAAGEYEIKLYLGETLAKNSELMDACRTGAIEMFANAMGPYSGVEPVFAEIPLLYDNVYAAAAASSKLMDVYNEVLPGLNLRGLNCYTTGGVELVSNKPVQTLDDFDGLLVGAISPDFASLADWLGASPVTISFTDTYSSLEKGVVDACFAGLEFSATGALADVADYSISGFFVASANMYVINLDIWNAMPEDIQDILLEEAQKAADEFNDVFSEAEDSYRADLASQGMDVYVVPKAERDIWKEYVAPHVDELIASIGALGAELEQIAAEANAANP